jgi:RNA polymerase sigma-70 factor (ECF subfamily)
VLSGEERERFERLMLPHLDAAYGLARWMTKNDELANDAVQEAFLRAFRFFGSLRGEDGRPWLLRIVRNACLELMQREQFAAAEAFDEERHDGAAAGAVVVLPVNPEAAAIERAERRSCATALPSCRAIFAR